MPLYGNKKAEKSTPLSVNKGIVGTMAEQQNSKRPMVHRKDVTMKTKSVSREQVKVFE